VALAGILQWYPVCTHANAEKKAGEALMAKGIEVYIPLRKELRRWSDRKKWVYEPLIRSYLFVRIPPQARQAVLMTKGIARFIYFSGEVAVMPERQIEQLKLLLAGEAELEVIDHVFEEGEKVLIKAGPLKGLRGELVAVHSRKRFVVHIDYTGKSIAVKVSAAFIEPV
jgi:transcription antitermination factor NusG